MKKCPNWQTNLNTISNNDDFPSGSTWNFVAEESDGKANWCFSWEPTPLSYNGRKNEGQTISNCSSDYVWPNQTEFG